MAHAKYSVYVPKHDTLGNPLADLAKAAHDHLAYGPTKRHIKGSQIHRGIEMGSGPHDVVVAYAEDSPEMDSHVKQVASFVGELANHPSLFVSKEGKNVTSWPIRNSLYRHGEPAEQLAHQRIV